MADTDEFNAAAWLVDRHVDEGRGDRVAIRCGGRSTTYAELLAEMWRAQWLLDDLGVRAGDRVAMVVQDDETFPALFLGALRAGAVPIPLSTMLEGTSLAGIVADCGARVLAISDTFAGVAADIAAAAPELLHIVVSGDATSVAAALGRDIDVRAWSYANSSTRATDTTDNANTSAASAADDNANTSAASAADDDANTSDAGNVMEAPVAPTTRGSQAFWLYSSGTTGTPKGVMHLHGNLPATVETYASRVLDVTPDDRCLSVAKLFFAYGLGNSLTFPFAMGATAILCPSPPTPALMAELITDERPTLFFSSPGFCAAMLDANPPPSTFGTVRATVTAGESLPANVQTRFAELTGSPVLDGIGSTELLHIFISNSLDEQVPGSSGHVVPGYEAELRDDNDNLVTEPDTPGYLHVRGPSAATGYWQRPEATAAAFREGWVRTGDVYNRSAAGHWTFLGRNNDMIKAGGIWVSPAEVESALIEHESVLEAAVVGARNDQGLETVVAFVVTATGASIDTALLEQHCRNRMAAFKRPRQIHVVDEFPKTATGKIKRFELRNRLTEANARGRIEAPWRIRQQPS
ncbi:benzoate-CoA ligase family protein [Candidatus Poriferisodalis sp.]|uniref:benzoate-CoA ligase family protein n=1 Tax=Candidatus Poriferisodalis sp. TaxID=3101277 RepID=UPI003D0B8FA7